MPEELEDGLVPSEEQIQPEEELQEQVEATPPAEEKRVPYTRFREVNEKASRLEAEMHEMRLAMMRMQQPQQPQYREPEPDIDPELEKLVAPVIQKQTRHLNQEIAKRDELLAQIAAKNEADKAWSYVVSNVPDIDELKPDIVAYLDSISPAMANKYTSDPDSVVMVANFVRAQKAAGNSMASKAAKQDLKNRAKTDATGGSRVPTSTTQTDWSTMSNEDFIAAQRKMGLKPINEW